MLQCAVRTGWLQERCWDRELPGDVIEERNQELLRRHSCVLCVQHCQTVELGKPTGVIHSLGLIRDDNQNVKNTQM